MYTGKEKHQFTSTRPGLGFIYWKDKKEEIKQNNGFYNDEQKLLTNPRYFKKLWEKENQEEYDRNEYKRKLEREDKEKKLEKIMGMTMENIRKKRYETLLEKWKKLRRDGEDE